jgi:predicted RNA polymerase sigma factor
MGKDNTLEDLCLSLLELARIDVQLMESEEEDKKSISLLGLREDLNPNAP